MLPVTLIAITPAGSSASTIGPDTPPAWMMCVIFSRAIRSRRRARSERSSITCVLGDATGSSPIASESRAMMARPTKPLDPVTRTAIGPPYQCGDRVGHAARASPSRRCTSQTSSSKRVVRARPSDDLQRHRHAAVIEADRKRNRRKADHVDEAGKAAQLIERARAECGAVRVALGARAACGSPSPAGSRHRRIAARRARMPPRARAAAPPHARGSRH